MKFKWNKTLKIGTALIAGVGLLGVSAATIVSCSSTAPVPETWSWEKYARGEYYGYGEERIDNSIPKIDFSSARQQGWNYKTEILLADWQRDFPTAQYIAANTFDYQNFPNLEYIEIPNTIRSIEDRAFKSDDSVDSHLKMGVKMANSVVYYGYAAFYKNKASVSLSSTLIYISSAVFLYAKAPTYTVVEGVKKIIFPSSLYLIGSSAFADLVFNNVETIELDFSQANNLMVISESAFAYKPNIVGDINYPAKVKKIDLSAFYKTSIESLSVDKSVTSIELLWDTSIPAWDTLSKACPSLKTLTLPASSRSVIEANSDYFDAAINYVYY